MKQFKTFYPLISDR